VLPKKGRLGKPFHHAVEDAEVFGLLDGGAGSHGQRTMSRIRHDVAVDVDGSEIQFRPSDLRKADHAHVEQFSDHARRPLENTDGVSGQSHAQFIELLQTLDA